MIWALECQFNCPMLVVGHELGERWELGRSHPNDLLAAEPVTGHSDFGCTNLRIGVCASFAHCCRI